MNFAGVATNGREAVFQALALKPDVILMDLRMPACDNLSATRLIKRPDMGSLHTNHRTFSIEHRLIWSFQYPLAGMGFFLY